MQCVRRRFEPHFHNLLCHSVCFIYFVLTTDTTYLYRAVREQNEGNSVIKFTDRSIDRYICTLRGEQNYGGGKLSSGSLHRLVLLMNRWWPDSKFWFGCSSQRSFMWWFNLALGVFHNYGDLVRAYWYWSKAIAVNIIHNDAQRLI